MINHLLRFRSSELLVRKNEVNGVYQGISLKEIDEEKIVKLLKVVKEE